MVVLVGIAEQSQGSGLGVDSFGIAVTFDVAEEGGTVLLSGSKSRFESVHSEDSDDILGEGAKVTVQGMQGDTLVKKRLVLVQGKVKLNFKTSIPDLPTPAIDRHPLSLDSTPH